MPRWTVEVSEEFDEWTRSLTDKAMIDVDASVHLLEERGPLLGFPHSSSVHGSKYGQMREVRVQHKGKPIRILYAFDPRRHAILLLGGDKTGKESWYEKNVPVADKIFTQHLRALKSRKEK